MANLTSPDSHTEGRSFGMNVSLEGFTPNSEIEMPRVNFISSTNCIERKMTHGPIS
jgi:hypothetical protein